MRHAGQLLTAFELLLNRVWLPSSGRRRRPEQRRQFVGGVGDPEHRPGRLEGQARFERPGTDGVEAEAIDELHHRSDRCSVIACRRNGDASGRTVRTPAFVELIVGIGDAGYWHGRSNLLFGVISSWH